MEKFKKIVDVGDRDKEGNTALHLAVLRRDIKKMEKLALNPKNERAKNNEGKTAFHLAVEIGDIEAAEILVNIRHRFDGDTALHHAIWINHTAEAIRLINVGANLNAQSSDRNDNTPLHMTVIEKNIRNCDGQTPLDLANSFVRRGTFYITGERKPSEIIEKEAGIFLKQVLLLKANGANTGKQLDEEEKRNKDPLSNAGERCGKKNKATIKSSFQKKT